MLLELTVENIAIIEKSSIELSTGFTCLTGETGAGKSLLIDSIGLALGGRAESELVRTGAARGTVTLRASIQKNNAVRELAEGVGAHLEEGELFIQRDVSAEGRSTCRIAGRPVPVSVLKQFGDVLVDLHGQHDHQTLLDAATHLHYLDLWIGDTATALRSSVCAQFSLVESTRREIALLRTDRRTREQRLDLLRFQVSEIEEAGVQLGEYEELKQELLRLNSMVKLAAATQLAQVAIDGDEVGAVSFLSDSVGHLESIADLDAAVGETLELLRTALYAAEDAKVSLRRYSDTLEADPERIEIVAGRIDLLSKLRKKYGDDERQILDFLNEAQKELDLLASSEEAADGLEARLVEETEKLEKLCADLTRTRRKFAPKFCELVQSELQQLAMEKAAFRIQIDPKPIDSSGADQLQFLFSANTGEAAKALNKIASGGELSRVMLSLKVVLSGKAGVPTLIFDEVDAGLSGRAAAVVANKLKQLAKNYQVIVISHLPQIASQADHHFIIEKIERSGRVITQVRKIVGDERVEEVARLLAGEKVSQSAIVNARELIEGTLAEK